MAVTINSNGTITGIAVGGLPDGVVDTDTLAADAVTAAKVADDVVNSEHLVDGGIDNAHLATGIASSKLSGNLPALNGSALTNLPAATSVAFPASQSASANANTLDDYEEGTWTPVIAALSTQSPSGQSYSHQVGVYTKIGRMVHVSCKVDLTAKGTLSGFLILNGLPFTVGSSTGNRGGGSCPQWGSTATSLVFCSVYPSEGTGFGYIRGAGSATATLAGLQTGDIGNSSWFYMTMTYVVN